jgi:hypothetical protein
MNHRVRLGDSAPTALEHLDALRRGFATAYRCFLASRDELSADDAVRAALSGLELRVLLRDTRTYARLLLYLLQPELLRNGLDRSIEIEWLARPLGIELRSEARASIYEAERRALEAQDVPRLTTTMWDALPTAEQDRDLLALGYGRTPNTFCARIAALSESDLEEQLAVIERAVIERFAPTAAPVGADYPVRNGGPASGVVIASGAHSIDIRIASRDRSSASSGKDSMARHWRADGYACSIGTTPRARTRGSTHQAGHGGADDRDRSRWRLVAHR